MSEKIPDLAIDLFKYRVDVQMDRGLNLNTRSFTLTGEVNLDMFHRTEACLSIFESQAEDETITIKLCSEGGEIYPALAIIGRIKASPCRVVIQAYGQIMSAATAIFACADERVASQYTSFMFHQTSISLERPTILRDVRVELAQSEHDDLVFSEILEKHSKRDTKYWQSLIKSGKNVYLSADECVELGLVDKVI